MADMRARVVLLGASNVTKGISIIVETARLLLGSPLDISCAIGHGRSYGMKSFVLVRSLPSILNSRLWDSLDNASEDIPTYALIADVGNDVMYGVEPAQIVYWVGQCVDRLQAVNARIVMTSLPIECIECLSPRHYLAARTLFFPTNRMSFQQALNSARETATRLQRLAEDLDVPLVSLPASWYGIDPIHIRPSLKPQAWQHVLRHWREERDSSQTARGSLARWIRLRVVSPDQWWLLGMKRGRTQPAVVLSDGTRFSMH